MKIKVSKVFADFINKTAKEMNFKVSAKVVEMSPENYRFFVDYNYFNAYDYGDVNEKTGGFKAIKLFYPEEFFVAPIYLTTYQLTKEFRRLKISTVAELKNMIKNMCEI